MVTALPPDRLNRIVERKADDIGISVLEMLEAGSYKTELENAWFTKEFISSSDIKLQQNKPFESGNYTVFTLPAQTGEYDVQSQTGARATHLEPAMRIAIPSSSLENFTEFQFPAALWNDVNQFEASFSRDKGLDIMFREIDALFRKGDFDKCNQLLDQLNVKEHSTNLLLGYLSITLAARDRLPARKAFVNRVEEKLRNHPDRNRLLAALR